MTDFPPFCLAAYAVESPLQLGLQLQLDAFEIEIETIAARAEMVYLPRQRAQSC
jgi:hypothetical protein